MQWLSVLVLNAALALANTEIVNLSPQPAPDPEIYFQKEWPSLDATYATSRWTLGSNPQGLISQINQAPCQGLFQPDSDDCLEELWVALDLDSWEDSYDKFTLRASWPASHPVDVYLKVFEPSEIAALPRPGPPRHWKQRGPPPSTKRKYARLQLVTTAVWAPNSTRTDILSEVPIVLTLEPLLFGVLPQSVAPTVLAIILMAALGYLIARTIIPYLGVVSKSGNDEKRD